MDYFSGDQERKTQKAFAKKRLEVLKPLLVFLTDLKITANHVTWLGVCFLLSVAFIPATHYWLVGVFLCLYVLTDGIDGPLARFQGNNHEGGSIVDIYADQLGVVLLPIMAIYHLEISGLFATAFTTGYLLFIVLALYQNSLNLFNRNFIRVKYPLYIIYFLSLVFQYTFVLKWFFAIFAVYYWVESHLSILRIYRHFDRKPND